MYIFIYFQEVPCVRPFFSKKQKSQIKATEEKTKISKPMLSGSGKNFLSFGSLDVA